MAQLVGSQGKGGLELVEIRRVPSGISKPSMPVAKVNPPKPPPVVRWQVKPDPLPAELTLPQKPEGALPITGYPPSSRNVVDQVVFPSSPSPFVSVAVKGRIMMRTRSGTCGP